MSSAYIFFSYEAEAHAFEITEDGSGMLAPASWVVRGRGGAILDVSLSLLRLIANFARVWHDREGALLGRAFEIYPLGLGKETLQQKTHYF